MLCSGYVRPDDPQKGLNTGMGALAGSTIMLLTWPWFLAVQTGRVNIQDGACTYKRPQDADEDWEKLSKDSERHLCSCGVAIGASTKKNALLMVATATTFFVVQVPVFMYTKRDLNEVGNEDFWLIVSLVLCCTWFLAYLEMSLRGSESDDAFQDKLVDKTVEGIKEGKVTIRGLLASVDEDKWKILRQINCGGLSEQLVERSTWEELGHLKKVLLYFFSHYDTNKNGTISFDEFRMLMKDLNENLDEATQRVIFAETDKDHNNDLSYQEFLDLIVNFSTQPWRPQKTTKTVRHPTALYAGDVVPESDEVDEADEEDMPSDLADLSPDEQQQLLRGRAFWKLTLGLALVLIFTYPMCDLLTTMGDKLDMSSFYVAFLLAPIAANASELATALKLASKKTKGSIDQALSALEGAAIMNNTFVLGIFMTLILCKRYVWKFAAETITVVVFQFMIGACVRTSKTQNLFVALCILMCYPMSLVCVRALKSAGFH